MEENEQPVWSADFPPNCPPAQAVAPGGRIFRFVKSDPPADRDFLPYTQLYPRRRFDDPCKARGLSVHRDLDAARRAQRLVPGFDKRYIAVAEVDGSHGRILPTPATPGDGHNTWWPPVGLRLSPLFTVAAPRLAD